MGHHSCTYIMAWIEDPLAVHIFIFISAKTSANKCCICRVPARLPGGSWDVSFLTFWLASQGVHFVLMECAFTIKDSTYIYYANAS